MQIVTTKENLTLPLSLVVGAADARGAVPMLGAVLLKTTGDKLSMLCSCRIPDDSIQYSRWPLFFAREVLQEVVDSLKTRKGEEDGTSSA
jgi:hypothetical protein